MWVKGMVVVILSPKKVDGVISAFLFLLGIGFSPTEGFVDTTICSMPFCLFIQGTVVKSENCNVLLALVLVEHCY